MPNSYLYRCIKVSVGVTWSLYDTYGFYLLRYLGLGLCGYCRILKNLNSTYSSLCWNWNELIYTGTTIYIVWGEIKKSWWKIRLKSIFNQIIDFNLIFRQHFFTWVSHGTTWIACFYSIIVQFMYAQFIL